MQADTYIPRRLDDQWKIGFWDVDVAAPIVLAFFIGYLSSSKAAFAACMAAGIAYGLVLDWLGYLIATILFMLIVTTLINVGRHKQNLIIAVLFSVISFISFALLLKLSLPRGLLGGILPF